MNKFRFLTVLIFCLFLVACFPETDDPGDSDDSDGGGGSGDNDSGDNGEEVIQEGLLVLAGGGAEGDVGDTDSWSYSLYSPLIENGSVQEDEEIRVAILSTSFPDDPGDRDWLGEYFVWIGETMGVEVSFYNVEVDSRSRANDSMVVAPVAEADVVFIRGGDQWEYVTWWGDTLLEEHIRDLWEAGGAIAGTSAGAMSLSSLTYASGQDMISTDVLYDSHSSYLDDRDGGSGIHTDFLPFLGNAVVDTHYTWRGRMGRLLGIHAKAIDDGADDDLLGIGIEEASGLIIEGGEGRVVGHGAVSFFTTLAETEQIREVGEPLIYSNVRLDRLADGWHWNLEEREPIPPASAEAVEVISEGEPNEGALFIDGGVVNDSDRFQWLAYDSPFELVESDQATVVREAVGHTDAMQEGERGYLQETLFSALADPRVQVGMLTFYDDFNGVAGTLERSSETPDILSAGRDLASIFISGRQAEFQSEALNFDSRNGVPSTMAISGLRVHVLADSENRGMAFNTRTGQVGSTAEFQLGDMEVCLQSSAPCAVTAPEKR